MRRTSSLPGPLVLLVVASLALAGCSGGGEAAEPETVETTHLDGTVEEVEVPEEPQTWPLTGTEVAGTAAPRRATRCSSRRWTTRRPAAPSWASRTPTWSSRSWSRAASPAWPPSSTPTSRAPWVPCARCAPPTSASWRRSEASIVTSGAANITLNRIDGAGITHYGEGYEGFFRESSRSAPYNLMANLTDVASTIKDKLARPDDYLPWGTADDLPKGPKATSINADFGNHTTTWQYGDGRYANTNSFAAADDQFPADSVLVLRVQVGDAGYRDPAGYPVPETKFVGEGAAVLFHAGRVIRGTWKKKELTSPLELSTKQGDLTVPAGRVWIELVPAVNGDLTWAK